MLRRLFVYGFGLLATIASTTAEAQDQWVLLGSKAVAVNRDTDSIDVSAARGNYRAVRIFARERGLQLNNVEVVYAGAPAFNERRPINLNQGERTRPIDERGGDGRFIDRVNLYYRPAGDAAPPTVIEVYGLQSADGARATRQATAYQAPPAVTTPIQGGPTTPGPTTARPGQPTDAGEVLFGTATVNFSVDRDIIRVGPEIGKFDRIRLRVLDNDIFINSMKVVYVNGESEEVAYNADVKKDTRTRWIDLKGDRFIKEIQFIYRSRPNYRGRGYVEVYGQYAEGWLGPQGEGKKYNAGFVLLGAQTAGFTIDRNDVIKVGRNEGGFKKIEVRVRDEAITLFEMRVIYGNGEVDIVNANRQAVASGAKYGPIDLKGGTRVIQEIRPTYRTRIFQQGGIARGRAVVEFWGQH